MSQFLRLLNEPDKAPALLDACTRLRQGVTDPRYFVVAPESFDAVPGKPFAYWVSENMREIFRRVTAFENEARTVKQGLATADDFRFVRVWWEICPHTWVPLSKGGAYSPFYADIYLVIEWSAKGTILKAKVVQEYGNAGKRIYNEAHYFRPGLTWPLRTQSGLSQRAMPRGCIFGHKGPAAFVANDDPEELLALLALTNSRAFGLLVSLQMAFGSYEVGVIQKTPVPTLTAEQSQSLAALARRAWSLKRNLDTVTETSHAFLLPAALRPRLGDYDPPAIEAELAHIQADIDALAFDLYGFTEKVASGEWRAKKIPPRKTMTRRTRPRPLITRH